MSKLKRERELEAEASEAVLEVEEDRRVARRTFVVAVAAAFVLSVFVNLVSRRLPPSTDGRWELLADLVFVLPVIAALWLGHAVLTLHRVGSTKRAQRQQFRSESRLFQVITVGASVFFVLVTAVSYKHQLAVAHWAGMTDWTGHVFPVAIDGALAVSVAALFVLRAASKADLRAAQRHTREALAPSSQVAPAVTVPVTAAVTSPVTAAVSAPVTVPVTAPVPVSSPRVMAPPDADTLDLARQLVSDGKIDADPIRVAELMDNGDIAALTELAGCSVRTWYRRLAAAKEQLYDHPRDLVAV